MRWSRAIQPDSPVIQPHPPTPRPREHSLHPSIPLILHHPPPNPSPCPHAPLNSARGTPFRQIAFQSQAPPIPLPHPSPSCPNLSAVLKTLVSACTARLPTRIVPHRSHSSIFALRLGRLATCTRRQPGFQTPPATRKTSHEEPGDSNCRIALFNPAKHNGREPTSPTVTPHRSLPRNPRR